MADELNPNGVATPPPERALPQDRLSTLRTYQADVQSVIRGENVSLASIALKERARALSRVEEAVEEPHSTRNTLLITLSIVLILAGIGTVSYFAFLRNSQELPITDTRIQSLLFAEKDTVIDTTDLSGQAVQKQIRESLAETRTLGEVENMLLAKKTPAEEAGKDPVLTGLSSQEFFRLLVPRAPDSFVRLLDGPYMYGLHGFGKNFGFLFLQSSDEDRTYSELLNWEKTSLLRDVSPLIREESTLSKTDTTPFQDALVKNIDARVVRDQDNEIVFIYAFLTPERLLIAGSEETFVEVLRRFTTPRKITQ